MSNVYPDFMPSGQFVPKEEMLEIPAMPGKISIGIPCESSAGENRVALVPDAVSVLIQNGHRVLIEENAGIAAHFENHQYSEAGGEIVFDKAAVFNADVILKVAPASLEEIELIGVRKTLISSLNPALASEDFFRKLALKKTTALAFEYIKDKTGSYPLIRAMSEIAGNTSMLIAAEFLSHPNYGRGKMLGGISGISPTEVVIIGAGTVGEYAARAALGMGAFVKVFDNSTYKLRRLQSNLNTRVYTSMIQPRLLFQALKTADVVIGALRSSSGRTPCVVSEDMVSMMKAGSLIIDVSIDQGGCVETSEITTHSSPVFKKHDITHYCVPNIASKVPHTASYALSNFFMPVLLSMAEVGGAERLLVNDTGMRNGAYLFNGILVKKNLADMFKIPFQDINLLMAAFQ
jgi:alanine dehydrogenase